MSEAPSDSPADRANPAPGKPRVSVIMATYNMGGYVGAAIESVLAQTIPDLELHVVDDGSTDDTAERVKPYLADTRVRYHYQPNTGQTAAKNRGIAASTGEFIGFCDADDLWVPEKLAMQIPVFEQHPEAGVVYARTREIDEHGNVLPDKVHAEPTGKVTQELFFENFVPFGTAMVRRSLLLAHGAFRPDLRMGIDWELWLRLSVHCEFQFVAKVAYLYRVWSGQMSKNWKGRYEACFRIMAEFEARHPNLIAPSTRRRAHSYSYVNRARARAVISDDQLGCLVDCARAITIGPAWRIALKTVLKSILRRF
jgi:glycosyltransferase involved in cell wall biosynthesis